MLWPLGLQSWSITYKQENSNEGRLPSGLHPLLLQQLMFQVGGPEGQDSAPTPEASLRRGQWRSHTEGGGQDGSAGSPIREGNTEPPGRSLDQ